MDIVLKLINAVRMKNGKTADVYYYSNVVVYVDFAKMIKKINNNKKLTQISEVKSV